MREWPSQMSASDIAIDVSLFTLGQYLESQLHAKCRDLMRSVY